MKFSESIRRALPVVVGVVTLAVIASCDNPGPSSSASGQLQPVPPPLSPVASQGQSGNMASRQLPAPPPAPVAKPAAPAPAEPLPKLDPAVDALYNSGLNEWADGLPYAWTAKANLVAMSAEAKDGGRAASLVQVGDVYASVSQVLPADAGNAMLGKDVLYGAWIKTGTKEAVIVQLKYSQNGEEQTFNVAHPGDGEWQNVTSVRNIPADADPASITFAIFRRPNAEGDVLVDKATCRITGN